MARIDLNSITPLPDPLAEALDPRAIIRETIGNFAAAGKVPNALNVSPKAADALYRLGRGYKSLADADAEIKRTIKAMIEAGELEAPARGPWRLLR